MAVTTRPEPIKTLGSTLNQKGVEGVIDNVTDKAKEVASAAGEYAGQAREKVQEWTSTAADNLSQARDKAQEMAVEAAQKTGEVAKDLGKEATDMIRRYPIPAILVGFGLGFLLARVSKS